MAKASSGTPLRQLRALFNVGTFGGLRDAELIERFTACSGEAAELAFTAIVERHGPMVLRVCQSVLHQPHDAQDAFQATFLVLVRKAGAIRNRDSLASWLHGVACRIADCARVAKARRSRHEIRTAQSVLISPEAGDRDDLALVLHEELDRLPEKYRAAIVLCHLEGLTHDQAAQQLHWPVGTVRSRLARGREQLRGRLIRRGVAVSVGVWHGLFSPEAARAALPQALVGATAEAAVRYASGSMVANGLCSASVALLVKGALSAMFVTKLKLTILAGGLIVTGAVVVAQQVGRGPETNTPRLPGAAVSDNQAPRQGALDDAAALNVAVARELDRLDLDVLTEDVHQLRDHVELTLRKKLRAERSKSGSVQDARSAYESARASYLASVRELRSQQRRLDALREPREAARESSRGAPPAGPSIEDQASDKTSPRTSASAVGSIDMDAVFQNYEKVNVFRVENQAATQARRKELQKLTVEAQQEEEILAKLSPGTADFRKHENRVTELKAQCEVKRAQAERESGVREAQTAAALYREIQDMAASVAKWRGLDYVIKVSPGIRSSSEPNEVLSVVNRSVVYADPRNDVTLDVIHNLNRKFKALGPGHRESE